MHDALRTESGANARNAKQAVIDLVPSAVVKLRRNQSAHGTHERCAATLRGLNIACVMADPRNPAGLEQK